MLALQVPIFPPLQKASDYTPAACSAMVRAALGIADPAFEIDVRSIRGWAMSAQVRCAVMRTLPTSGMRP